MTTRADEEKLRRLTELAAAYDELPRSAGLDRTLDLAIEPFRKASVPITADTIEAFIAGANARGLPDGELFTGFVAAGMARRILDGEIDL